MTDEKTPAASAAAADLVVDALGTIVKIPFEIVQKSDVLMSYMARWNRVDPMMLPYSADEIRAMIAKHMPPLEDFLGIATPEHLEPPAPGLLPPQQISDGLWTCNFTAAEIGVVDIVVYEQCDDELECYLYAHGYGKKCTISHTGDNIDVTGFFSLNYLSGVWPGGPRFLSRQDVVDVIDKLRKVLTRAFVEFYNGVTSKKYGDRFDTFKPKRRKAKV